MKISNISTHVAEPHQGRTWLFVRVEIDNGIVGWGEASQTRNDAAVAYEIERIKGDYIGKSPLNLIEQSQSTLRWPYIGKSVYAAVSAIEQALWDSCGKALGVPVYQLLGGSIRDRIRLYANIGYAIKTHAPAEYASVAHSAVAEGFTAVKLYAFGIMPDRGAPSSVLNRWIKAGVERLRAVREAVGDDVDILVDMMHQLNDLEIARQIYRLIEPLNLFWVEDPFGADHPGTLAAFRNIISTRLAGGAPYLDIRQYIPLLAGQALDVLMPDLKWNGGLLASKKAAALADMYGTLCAPHNASGPVASAANLHLAAGLSNFLILEYAWDPSGFRAQLSRSSETLVDGHLLLPRQAGLGIDMDESMLANNLEQMSVPRGALEMPPFPSS